jgi:hypothetical protein
VRGYFTDHKEIAIQPSIIYPNREGDSTVFYFPPPSRGRMEERVIQYFFTLLFLPSPQGRGEEQKKE